MSTNSIVLEQSINGILISVVLMDCTTNWYIHMKKKKGEDGQVAFCNFSSVINFTFSQSFWVAKSSSNIYQVTSLRFVPKTTNTEGKCSFLFWFIRYFQIYKRKFVGMKEVFTVFKYQCFLEKIKDLHLTILT